jgi:hypothetical protein
MGRILALVGGGLVGGACFLPLVSASVSFAGISGTGHMSGTDTTAGKVALVLGFAALLLASLDLSSGRDRFRRQAAAAAILGALIVVYKSWSVTSTLRNPVAASYVGHVSVGIGMWVALFGGGAALASAFVARDPA